MTRNIPCTFSELRLTWLQRKRAPQTNWKECLFCSEGKMSTKSLERSLPKALKGKRLPCKALGRKAVQEGVARNPGNAALAWGFCWTCCCTSVTIKMKHMPPYKNIFFSLLLYLYMRNNLCILLYLLTLRCFETAVVSAQERGKISTKDGLLKMAIQQN